MNYILFDPPEIERFYPFTLTRPLAEMRIFGGTIKEIWERFLGCKVSHLTSSHLSELYPTNWSDQNILIPSTHLPSTFGIRNRQYHALELIGSFQKKCDLKTVQAHFFSNQKFSIHDPNVASYKCLSITNQDGLKVHVRNCFGDFPEYINSDNALIHSNARVSLISKIMSTINYHDQLYDGKKYFSNTSQYDDLIELKLRFPNAFFNNDDGPIVIEDDVTIMEGVMIRGPVYIGKASTIKMGAKIYGHTIIGPQCKIGGEISNCVFLGFSNKAHEGFLGHSIIGEWCNIGAGTSNSNLKNDYGVVKMWDYSERTFQSTFDLKTGNYTKFLGLYMGDHSKCAINTSFNTGTVVGVNCNIFGSGFPRNFIPSFSWGGAQGIKEYDLNKAILVAKEMMKRRDVCLEKGQIEMLSFVHRITSKYR